MFCPRGWGGEGMPVCVQEIKDELSLHGDLVLSSFQWTSWLHIWNYRVEMQELESVMRREDPAKAIL